MAENRYFAGSRLEQSLKDFNGGGLSRPVRTEQAKAFPSFNLQVETAYGFDFSVVSLAQIATLDGNRHAGILTEPISMRRSVT